MLGAGGMGPGSVQMSSVYGTVAEIDVVSAQDAVVVALTGRLGGDVEQHVGRAMDDAARLGVNRIVVDFSLVGFVTSPVIRHLGRCRQQQAESNGILEIAGLRGAPRRALQTAGVLREIRLWPDVTAAFGGSAG